MNNGYEIYINDLCELEKLLSSLAGDQTGYKPAENKWNINEIAAHLADAEIQAYVRYRSILSDDIPFLVYNNQDKWSVELKHSTIPVSESYELLKIVRLKNYNLICSLTGEQMRREGLHSTKGKMTLEKLVESNISHLEKHISQIKRNIEYYKSA
ncbi:MAG TPA: DinB family protein [Ignavibacteriaceae bacterium]|nr:DinB family protein [Ignavibacteriaceae bacterium]